MMKRYCYVICFFGFLTVLILLNFRNSEKNHADMEKEQKDGPRVMAILPMEHNLFWDDVWEGLRTEAEQSAYGLSEYEFEDIEEEQQLLDIAARTKADGILLCPKHTPDMKFYEQLSGLREEGVKIAILDANISPAYYDAFIGIDNYAAGEQIAQYICDRAEPGVPIVLVRNNSALSVTIQKRMDGFYSVMKKNNHLSDICPLETSSDVTRGISDIQDILRGYDTPFYVAALGPNHTLKSAYAVATSELSDLAHVVGFGETEEALHYVDTGIIEALFMQDNVMLGQRSAQIMEDLLLDAAPVSRDNKIKLTMVSAENIQEYVEAAAEE